MTLQKNLSWMANTPEFQQARILAQNGGRGEWTFYTTMGHIVTKILDMDIRFTLPDGSEYHPFTTVWEVNTFFRISPDQYGDMPNRYAMDHFVGELYRRKIAPKERETLDPQKETMSDFFRTNVWWALKEGDTIDMLLDEIDALVDMWIVWVDRVVCDDIRDWIVKNAFRKDKDLSDWYQIPVEDRKKYTIDLLDKDQFTDYFADLAVEYPWRKHPLNAYRQMDSIQSRLRALYVVDADLEKIVWKEKWDRMRNTRYI